MKILLIIVALLTLIFIGCGDSRTDNYSIDVQSAPTATPMPANMG